MIQANDRANWKIGIAAACILLTSTTAIGQVSVGVGIAVPGFSIGINIPSYPELVPIPGYPVYYAPQLGVNLFFYDGLYWTLAEDNWYYSSWYDGPWYLVQPELVPAFILRVPVGYYRRPPSYFFGWNRAAPPRWGEHWGRGWERKRRGWDRWDRASMPQRAPLPQYQRRYPRDRYPGANQQRNLENRYYRYTPRDSRDRSRLQQSPQLGQRLAPQQNRPAPERRRPEGPPRAQRGAPGMSQRPAVTSPAPPARAGQPRSDANRRPSAPPPRATAGPRLPDRQPQPQRQQQPQREAQQQKKPGDRGGQDRRPPGNP